MKMNCPRRAGVVGMMARWVVALLPLGAPLACAGGPEDEVTVAVAPPPPAIAAPPAQPAPRPPTPPDAKARNLDELLRSIRAPEHAPREGAVPGTACPVTNAPPARVWRLPPTPQDKETLTVDDLYGLHYTNTVGEILPYRLFVPDVPPDSRVPLVLFLHGAGEAGFENRWQLLKWPCGMVFAQPANQREHPCFFLAPQHPGEIFWADSDKRAGPYLRLSVELIDDLATAYPEIDTNRLYITGLCSGGNGAWVALYVWPHKFAAAVPVQSFWSEDDWTRENATPAWAFTTRGRHDGWFARKVSEEVETVRKAGAEARCTIYDRTDHKSWVEAYADPELIPWLFSQRSAKSTATTHPDSVPPPRRQAAWHGMSVAPATNEPSARQGWD